MEDPRGKTSSNEGCCCGSGMEEGRMGKLFKTAIGTEFDSKSRDHRNRMAQLKELLSGDPELAKKSDAKIALIWFRSMK
jgi:hypothetical protein